MEIRIAGTENDSIVDGPGFRFTIFVQGCPHNCEGCHNPQTHDFNGGRISDTDELLKSIKDNPLLDGVTFSGGEPFCQAKALSYLGKQIKDLGMDIITYTGFTLEFLMKNGNNDNCYKDLLSVSDYIVDGKFELAKKNLLLNFKGSSNQRIIDMKDFFSTGRIVNVEL